eukprot:scaffold41714_cov51-Phaeocystis_antarctica.AAC.1
MSIKIFDNDICLIFSSARICASFAHRRESAERVHVAPALGLGARRLARPPPRPACRKQFSLRGAFARNTPIGGPAGARRRWKLANRRPLHDGELSCPLCSGRRFPRSLRRRAVAGPPTVRFSRRAPTW